jgi:hypothetical protein
VLEHAVTVWHNRRWARIFCEVCGSQVDVEPRTSDEDVLEKAWTKFLSTVPWDCEEAYVRVVMLR